MFLLGIGGVILIFIGLIVGNLLSIILLVAGFILSTMFLWPAFGSLMTGQQADKRKTSFEFIKKLDKPQILDCGCGTGRHAIQLAKEMPEGSYLTGIDIYNSSSISINTLEQIKINAQLEGVADKTKFLYGSITEIPFEDDKFDVVSCMGVIHELRTQDDKDKAFQEITRVLKPDGIFYFRELNPISMISTCGFIASFFKNKKYWINTLRLNNFKIIKEGIRNGRIEIIAKINN